VEPVQAVLALVLALALALVPGMLALAALRPGAGAVRNLALAPAVSLGLLWISATVLGLVHLPVAPGTVLPIALGVPLLGAVVVRRRGTSAPRRALRVDRWDVAGIATGIVLSLVLWVSVSQWLRLGVPNDDGSHHGFYTARILVTSSLDPAQVLVGDVITGTPTYDFYPLAIHLMAALIAATGLPVAVALNATWIVLASLGFALGMYALARRTFVGARRAAIAVAVLAPVMPQLPVTQMFWGGAPLIVGMALLPAVVDAAVGSVRDASTTRARIAVGAALGLAVVGLFFAHTTEVLTAVLLTVCLAFGTAAQRGPWVAALRRPSVLVALVGSTALVALLALAPYARRLVGGVGERAGWLPTPVDGAGDALSTLLDHLVGPTRGLLVVLGALVVVGAVVGVRRRLLGGWLWFTAVVVALGLALAFGWPGSTLLTTPWYRDLDRIAYHLVYPGVVMAALGGWWPARALRDALRRTSAFSGPRGRSAAAAVVLVLVGVLPLAMVLRESVDRATGTFTGIAGGFPGGSLAGPDARAAFAWLAANTEPGDRVLNEFADGSAWMYAEERVLPLFGAKVAAFPDQWGDREYLLAHAADYRIDPRVRELMDEWDVRYAYLGGRLFPDHDPSSDPALTVESLVEGGWTIVFQQGDATVLAPPSP
jgi:hypothetical protein